MKEGRCFRRRLLDKTIRDIATLKTRRFNFWVGKKGKNSDGRGREGRGTLRLHHPVYSANPGAQGQILSKEGIEVLGKHRGPIKFIMGKER